MEQSRSLFAVVLAIIVLFSRESFQISTPESKTYWGAVVEFSSEPYTQLSYTRVENAAIAYMDMIESEEASLVDIIVFPEGTLNSIGQAFELPEPALLVAPCDIDTYHEGLRNISCSANRAKKYVVINVTEMKNHTPEEEELVYYNTNVVFDREGRIISRYRKYNLFGEAGISVPPTVDISFFTTDFNVTFGHFICFDILFKSPALELSTNPAVTDILYPTMWFSELPFLTAVQAQNMWAYKQKLNFLGAGASNPIVGSTGSGIYSKQGPIKATMSGTPLRHLIVAEVPKKQYWNDPEVEEKFSKTSLEIDPQDELLFMKRDNLKVYSAKYLDFELSTDFTEQLCYGALCCDFVIQVTNVSVSGRENSYKHFMVAFDGVRDFDGFATGGVFTCALISCLDSTLASCGLRYPSGVEVAESIRFDVLKIEGYFRATEDTEAFPNTVDWQLNPLTPSHFVFEDDLATDSHQRISMSLVEPNSRIYTFGIYGRDFAKDGMEPSSGHLIVGIEALVGLMAAFVILRTFY